MTGPSMTLAMTCLIADDHPMVSDVLASIVRSISPAASLLKAADWPKALAAASASPELCILDLTMPGGDPRACISRLRELLPDASFVIVSGQHFLEETDDLLAEIDAVFVPKTAAPSAIRAALVEALSARTCQPIAGNEAQHAPNAPAGSKPLSPRQHHILQLIATGQTNKQIARELGISPDTIKTHVANILDSVGAQNRAEAVMRARTIGLL